MLKKSILILALLAMPLFSQSAYSLNITSLTLYTDDNGGTSTPTTQMTPANEMTLAIATDAESLRSMTVTIYNSELTTESGCYNTDTRTSADRCAWLEWKNNSGENLITDIRPTQTSWLLDRPNSEIDPSGVSLIVFTPAKSSRYSSDSSWVISVTVETSNASSSYDLVLNNTYYIGLEPSKDSISFEPGRAGTSGHPLSQETSSGYQKTNLPLTIVSNAPYTWQVKSADFTGSSGILLSSDALAASQTDAISSATYLTSAYQSFGSSETPTKESGETKNIFMWLDYPAGDPDTTYESSLYLQAYITSNPSYITSEYEVSLNATTDNTNPSIRVLSPSPLSWSKSGNIISYTLGLADNYAGFMNSLTTNRCYVYFDGSLVSSAYATKDPDYQSCSCSGSFVVPDTGNRNANLNFTVRDMSGNLAYNDTVWLQVDLSSLYIGELSLISTPKPYDVDWYFLPSDTFRILARVKNNVDDSVTSTVTSWMGTSSGSYTINSQSASSSSPYEYGTTGNIDLEYDFDGASVGDRHIFITARDIMNNTVRYNHTYRITNYLESVRITTNFTNRVYTQGDNISISIDTNSGSNPVYMGNITATVTNREGIIIETVDMNTDTSGESSFYLYIPEEPMSRYIVAVTGSSPLDTSVTLTNTSYINTEWLDITVNTDNLGYILNGSSTKITAWGSIYYSEDIGNETLMDGASVTCFLDGPRLYNQTCTTKLDKYAEYTCNCFKNVTIPGQYRLEISAEKSINGNTLRGWNKDEYVQLTGIYDYGNVISSGIISTSDCLEISGDSPVTLNRGSAYVVNLTVWNYCDSSGDILLDSSVPDRIADSLLVSYTTNNRQYVAPNSSGVFGIMLSVGDVPYATHNLSISSRMGDSGINFPLLVTIEPTAGEIGELQQAYVVLEDTVAVCRNKMDSLDSGNALLKALESKLADAEEMLVELKVSIDSGNYALAESYIGEIQQKLDGVEGELDLSIESQDKSRMKNMVVGIILIAIIALGILVWYMWLPEKPTDYEFRTGKSGKVDSRSVPASRISDIAARLRRKMGFGKDVS